MVELNDDQYPTGTNENFAEVLEVMRGSKQIIGTPRHASPRLALPVLYCIVLYWRGVEVEYTNFFAQPYSFFFFWWGYLCFRAAPVTPMMMQNNAKNIKRAV
jgi:hypothetical protein